MINDGRPKDAVELLLDTYQKEFGENRYSRHISDARNWYNSTDSSSSENKQKSELEVKMEEWAGLPTTLATQFKLVIAMIHSGGCKEAFGYINDGIQKINNVFKLILEEQNKPDAAKILLQEEEEKENQQFSSSSNKKRSLESIIKLLKKEKAMFLVCRSKCAPNAELMAQIAVNAFHLAPNYEFVVTHAQQVSKIIASLSAQNMEPKDVIFKWEMTDDGQNAVKIPFQKQQITVEPSYHNSDEL